ncbi:FluC/FEX family fluoride channel [Corynebacterium kalidii]|uniref:Fluoride-specific ion channel FluC n=1 Tax=Corynebacterium kalidii TaxID=2931982 RepID=A0A9X1WFP7_9CORY|nr:CrcB family protein [Corynebacterium kalidii]MCJ7857601.1 CrcB family protein [Corynebacterium kalidii]
MTIHLSADGRTGGLVFIGGAAGAFLRWAFTVDTGVDGSLWPLLVINLLGAMLMGTLVGYLPVVQDTARRARLKATLGTGLLGGFTSYSAIAAAAVLDADNVVTAVVYVVGTVVTGVLLARAGVWCGERLHTGDEGAGAES